MLGGGVAVILLGALLAIAFAPAALALAIYGAVTKSPRVRITRWVAVGLAMLAVLATWPIWQAAITGRGGRGEPVNVWDDGSIAILLLVEAVALLAAIAVPLWRGRGATPASTDP